MNSWVIEGSLSGDLWDPMEFEDWGIAAPDCSAKNKLLWTEIHWITDDTDLRRAGIASFAVTKSVECCYIRRTQTNEPEVYVPSRSMCLRGLRDYIEGHE
jgi:hypothetical protein